MTELLKQYKRKIIILSLLILIIVGGVFLVWSSFPIKIQEALATVAGPQSAGTGGNDTGVGTIAWSNTSNITSSDNSRATATLRKNKISNYLTATGFDFSAIPDGSLIVGITVKIERSEAGLSAKGGILDNEVRIIQGGTIDLTQNKADTTTFWPEVASESYATYGGPSDLWGLSWTSDQIKASNFGLAIAAQNERVSAGGATETAQIDHIRITIEYSAKSNTDQYHFQWRNDDGTESTATWKTAEDSNSIGNVSRNTTIRLRIKSQNTGIFPESVARTYELQWGEKSTDCSSISTWTGVADSSDAWEMAASQLVEGQSITTERLTTASSFVNGEERETADTTGSIGPLVAGAGTEFEFSIQATNSAAGGATYCFRLYDTTAGSALDSYSVYPEATIVSEYVLEQVHYRWRNDDGGETTGTKSASILRPNGDFSVAWTTAVPPDTHYTTIDEVVIQPTAGTTSDYIEDKSQAIDDFEMETLSGSGSYTQVDVWVYAMTAGNEKLDINLVINGTPQTAQRKDLSGSYTWYQASFTGLSMNQTDLDGLVVRLQDIKVRKGDNVDVATMYAEVFEDVSAATFNAAEDIAVTNQAKSENVRARFLIKNGGPDSAGSQNYRLQFATMAGVDCGGGDEAFSDVPAQVSCGSSAVCMATSDNFDDQEASSNISPGLTDPPGTFVSGKLVEDTSNEASSITLANGEFTELEYNFEFTTNATDGGNYCFRVSRGGTALTTYTQVAKITLAGVGGYATSGTYTSSSFDTGSSNIFNVIEWTESKTNPSCLSCTIKLQIKTAPDSGGLPGTWSATWSGPDGEDGDETDYFTTSAGELIHTDHNGDQWVQYKATLDGDGTDTPILQEIRINYQ